MSLRERIRAQVNAEREHARLYPGKQRRTKEQRAALREAKLQAYYRMEHDKAHIGVNSKLAYRLSKGM